MTQHRYRSVLTAEGAELHGELGFRPQAVTVDNISASWAFVPEGGRYIPPFQYGVVLPLVGAGQTSDILWRTPPGLQTPTQGNPLGQLTAIFTDAQLAPSNGQSVIVPSQQVPCAITAVTQLTGGATAVVGATSFTLGATASSNVIVQVALPPGANSVMVVSGNALNIAESSWSGSIFGVESATLYYAGPVPASLARIAQGAYVLAAVVSSAADQHLQLNFTQNVGGGTAITFRVIACYATQATQVEGAGPGSAPVVVQGVVAPTAPGSTVYPVLTSPYALGVADTAQADQSVGSGAAVSVLGGNSARVGVILTNTGSTNLRVSFDTTPTATTGVRLAPGVIWARTMPYCRQGAVLVISEVGTGTISVYEET